MDLHEQTAQFWATETCATLREEFARAYRRQVGVLPKHRKILREALVRVANGGGMPPQDVLDLLNRRYAENGSADGGE